MEARRVHAPLAPVQPRPLLVFGVCMLAGGNSLAARILGFKPREGGSIPSFPVQPGIFRFCLDGRQFTFVLTNISKIAMFSLCFA
jgi:hypothetical protein